MMLKGSVKLPCISLSDMAGIDKEHLKYVKYDIKCNMAVF